MIANSFVVTYVIVLKTEEYTQIEGLNSQQNL